MNSISNLVFNPPAAGKPEPWSPPPQPGEPDTRPRVMQQGTKSNTCWYYAFNTLRDRVGQHPSVGNTPERQFEKAASARRKYLSKHEAKLPGICDQLNQPTVANVLSRMTPSDPSGGIPPVMISVLLGTSKELSTSRKKFVRQRAIPDFFAFLVDQKFGVRNRINRDFLKQVGVESIDGLINAKIKQFPEDVRGEIEQSDSARASIIDSVVRDVCAEKFGLGPVKWAPGDGLAAFFAAVEIHGPLVIAGLFGKKMYTVPPYKMEGKVHGRDIYAWKPNSPRLEDAKILAHTVVVIGVRKQDKEKGLVYFVDPDDGSDPLKSMPQPIYAMSFASLMKHILTVDGVQKSPSRELSAELASAGFALARVQRRKAV